MNARAHRPLARRQARHTPLGRFAEWVNTKLEARRARRLEEETVACLSAMDSKLLNDIGMDIGTLGDLANEPTSVHTTNIVVLPRRPNRRRRS